MPEIPASSHRDPIERLILSFDRALRTLAAPIHARRANPAGDLEEVSLSPAQKAESGRLMRVNHTGEVCAQALYQGQMLTVRTDANRQALAAAADEELDHLAWCGSRLEELGARTSLLNPVFYAASFALGAASGLAGDRWNLAFLVETERQVEHHLSGHLERLPEPDQRSRSILEQMRNDEAGHAEMATSRGAASMPRPLKALMKLVARGMTRTAYRW